jgi:hypothetical protein
MTGFDERGLLTPTSSATIAFYSPARGRLLLLSPMQNGAGLTISPAARGSYQPAARGGSFNGVGCHESSGAEIRGY